jgi:hypothetical protein
MLLSGFLPIGQGGTVPDHRLRQPDTRRAFHTLRRWALAYLSASMLTLIASFVEDGGAIGVWIRCAVVVLIAAVINVLLARAERGHRRAYRVLRVFAYLESLGFIVVALIVPGYPPWLRIAQAVIGVFAVGTAVATTDARLRRTFASES